MKDTIQQYVDEFKSWKNTLQEYWPAIDKNQEMYEFYKQEDSETESQISLNTPFAIVESMVAKANDSTLSVTVNAKGEKGLNELEKWVSSILKDAIEDPDIAQYKGTFRKIREKFFRNLLVQGNAVAQVEWFKKKDASGKILANNPYTKVLNLKSVIFNPTKTLVDSDVYYLETWVKFSDLKKNEADKSGNGLYKNLGKVKKEAAENKIDLEDEYYYSNGKRIAKKGEPIRVLTRWEGAHMVVIANDSIIIREEDDPFKLGGHNLILAMNYVVGDRPYAYGEIDPIYKPVRAQDTVINQSIDIVNKFLRDRYLIKPGSGIDGDALMDILEYGGVAEGDPALIGVVPVNPVPPQAFQTIDTVQQAIERAARFSPYSNGTPNQATDKTSGTKGGIIALQSAAEPNFQVKLDCLEESFARPDARMKLKMIANLMSPTDLRYGMLQGKTSEWVKANKNILQGRAKISDLVEIGYLTEDQAMEYTHTLQPVGVNPDGSPIMQPVPIPGAEKALVFDIDWLIDVRLDNQSASDKELEAEKDRSNIEWGMQMGVPINPEKAFIRLSEKRGFDDVEDIMFTAEEQQQQQMMQQQQMQAQQDQEMQMRQMEMEAKAQSESMKNQGNLQRENLRGQTALTAAHINAQARQNPQPTR